MTEEKYGYEMFFTVDQDDSSIYLPNHKSSVLRDDDLTEEQLKGVFGIFLNHPDCYSIHIRKEGFVHDTRRENDE